MRRASAKSPASAVWGTALTVALAAHPAGAQDTDLEELPPELQPQEASLTFISTPPERPIPLSRNTIRISEQSLEDGWVRIVQCHEQLDPFPKAEIVYQYHRMRGLELQSSEGIAKAWVQGQTVQLVDVRRGASLCVSADVNILKRRGNGYVLENGPFHRKFLDGYFPLHVQLDIHYPKDRLHFSGLKPDPQPGFKTTSTPGRLSVDARFTGKLTVRVKFERAR